MNNVDPKIKGAVPVRDTKYVPRYTSKTVAALTPKPIIHDREAEYNRKSQNSVVKQGISSADTSISQIPALFTNKNVQFGKTNIDIGGGRFDLATNYLAQRGTKNMIFDPYTLSFFSFAPIAMRFLSREVKSFLRLI